jgi:hypothetical protein
MFAGGRMPGGGRMPKLGGGLGSLFGR